MNVSYTPKQWYDIHNRVWRVFQDQYAGDTGSVVTGNTVGTPWIASDSGFLAQEAVTAEALRVQCAAHQPTSMIGMPNALDSNNMLKKMARGSGLTTDTGKQGGSA